ncbi:MAG: hypothetical protein WDZ85_01820 [Candidatus Paceibacterota bacterium]
MTQTLYDKNYSGIERFIFKYTILRNFKYIIFNPVAYTLISIINLFFLFNIYYWDKGVLGFFVIIYSWSIIGTIIFFLDKYKIIIFLDTKDVVKWRRHLKIYFYIIVGFMGMVMGAIMMTLGLFVYVIGLLSRLNLIDQALVLKIMPIAMLIGLLVWPIKGILNKEIRILGAFNLKVKGILAVILSIIILFLIVLIISLYIFTLSTVKL